MTPSDKYRILKRFGQQQRRKFGDVFLVEDTTDGSLAVMKVVIKSDQTLLQARRLREEARFDFDHPQLPATRHIYESEHELVVVKSYFEGQPLQAVLPELKRKEKPAFAAHLLNELVPVFEALDKAGVLHLDIKPSNLIIQGNTTDFTVALIDFGMAFRMGTNDPRSVLFPLGYAAPELLLNRLHLADRSTDFFALGIVIWQLFTGKIPLLHPNPSITTNLQLTHPLPEHPAIPKHYYTILRRMCAKHSFRLPPNKLTDTETDNCLKNGMHERYPHLHAIIHDWHAAMQKKRWFER